MSDAARTALAVLALLALSGCAPSSNRPAQWTRVAPATTPPARPAPPPTAPSAAPAPVPAPRPAEPAPASAPPAGGGAWLSFRDWARSVGQAAPQAVTEGSSLTWRLETPAGTLSLVPGTRVAALDGVSLWLGFAPIAIVGDCLVHPLDLRKNLAPLLGPAAGFPPALRTVVIDPGHGGENAGTRSVLPGVFEKDLTLDWGLRLADQLRLRGYQVILTRTNDVDLPLADRVAVAERAGADLFISLHFNSAFPQTSLAGLETFCLTPAGMPSTLTRNYEDYPTRIFANNAHDEQNLRYAFRLHRGLLQAIPGADRGVRRARFMGVLRGQNRPAVLLEAGYLSNPDEARRIVSPEHRQQLADAVARALDLAPRYAGEGPAPPPARLAP